MPNSVEVYIYDLSQGMASQFSGFVGFQLEGIWHTSVVCFGHEWFFGGGGIEQCPPGGTMLGQPLKKVPLGSTKVDFQAFKRKLEEFGRDRFAGKHYSLLDNNCNNFSNELARFLTGTGIPQYILDLPERVKASPIAALLAPLIEAATPRGEDFHDTEQQQQQQQAVVTYRHFPHTEYITFKKAIEQDKFAVKLREVVMRNVGFISGESVQNVVAAILALLVEDASLTDKAWQVAAGLIKAFPEEDVFPILDALRWITSQTALNAKVAKLLVEEMLLFLKAESSSTNMQLAVKILCNLFVNEDSRKVMLDYREQLVSRMNTLLEDLETPSEILQIGMSSLVFNYATIFLQKADQEAVFQIVSALCTSYITTLKAPEALYRSLVALGTLVCSDPEARDLALALDAVIALDKVKSGDLLKLQECIEDCKKVLA